MKKIYLVTSNQLPVPAVMGGAVELLLQILLEENEKDPKVEFYLLCKYNDCAYEIAKTYKHAKVFYYKNREEQSLQECAKSIGFDLKFCLHKIISKVINKFSTSRYYYYAYLLAKRIKPDYIVAEAGPYEQFNIFKNKFSKDILYAHLHRVVEGEEKYWAIFQNAIGVSNYISNRYQNGNNAVKTYTVYNCANETTLTKVNHNELEIRTRYSIDNSDFVVIYIGRVTPEKGVQQLVDAVLAIDNIPMKLLIVGGSAYANSKETEFTKSIRMQAEHSNGKIIMTGYVDNNCLIDYFHASDVCVVPSMYEEPLALTPLEAMIAGVPVIITDSGGMKEYSSNGYPLVVNRGSEFQQQLISNLLRLYNSVDFRQDCVEQGLHRSKDFGRSIFFKDFVSLFDK